MSKGVSRLALRGRRLIRKRLVGYHGQNELADCPEVQSGWSCNLAINVPDDTLPYLIYRVV